MLLNSFYAFFKYPKKLLVRFLNSAWLAFLISFAKIFLYYSANSLGFGVLNDW